MALYLIPNGPSPTTAAQVAVTTGTAIKTLLQVATGATKPIIIVEWGISFSGFALAAPVACELIEVSHAATVTAHVTAGIIRLDGEAIAGGDPVTNLIPVSTTTTGYTATDENASIATSRLFDVQYISPMGQYVKQFPLGREPVIQISKFARIRVTVGTAVNAYCYMIVQV